MSQVVLDAVVVAVSSLKENPLRTSLTALGIVTGVGSVVLVLGLISSVDTMLKDQLDQVGDRALLVRAETTVAEAMTGAVNRVSHEDYLRLVRNLSGSSSISPSFDLLSPPQSIRNGSREMKVRTIAATSNYSSGGKLALSAGRFISEDDNDAARSVVVVGDGVRRKLGDPRVGSFIELGGQWMRVVGLTRQRGTVFGIDRDDFVIIPFETALELLPSDALPDLTISVTPGNGMEVDALAGQVRHLLLRDRDGKPRHYLKIESADQITATFTRITRAAGVVATCVVAISLVVGGIGVMNIMLIAVSERTREIGLYRALGATSGVICARFLIEAMIVSGVGAVAGAVGGVLACLVITASVESLPVTLPPWWSYLIAAGSSAAVGLIAGYMPAVRAARMHPVAALSGR